MTTNVFDKSALALATDSRWSFRVQNHAICYVDDTGFDKVFIDGAGNFAACFAGNANLIELWKTWLATDLNSPEPPVFQDGMSISICLVDREGSVLIDANQDIFHEDGSRFAGSGALDAYECWKVNKSATKAVESAKLIDLYSGGSVKSADLSSGSHNIANDVSLQDVNQIFIEKGFVMYLTNPQPVEFGKAAANDPLLQQVKADLSAGNVQISAPCDSMYQDWSAEQKSKLASAVSELKHRYR